MANTPSPASIYQSLPPESLKKLKIISRALNVRQESASQASSISAPDLPLSIHGLKTYLYLKAEESSHLLDKKYEYTRLLHQLEQLYDWLQLLQAFWKDQEAVLLPESEQNKSRDEKIRSLDEYDDRIAQLKDHIRQLQLKESDYQDRIYQVTQGSEDNAHIDDEALALLERVSSLSETQLRLEKELCELEPYMYFYSNASRGSDASVPSLSELQEILEEKKKQKTLLLQKMWSQ